ncbi:hypothetical protein IAR55_005902 [Kwoniella newhampshirensis]|uniref:Vacuolar fusion protein MON1 n=1 Tax=Kwoniella newhampshirensis TaxID=1651941 RepID=A0AAW0YVB4_9TREE
MITVHDLHSRCYTRRLSAIPCLAATPRVRTMPPHDAQSQTRLNISTRPRSQSFLPPTPIRSTSHLSTISVDAQSSDDSPKKPIPPSKSVTPTKSISAGLLNAPLSSPALRARALTASSSRASSVYEGLPGNVVTTASLSTPISGDATDVTSAMEVASLGEGSGSRAASVASSRKGKQRAVEQVDVEPEVVEGEMAVATGDARKGLRDLVQARPVTQVVTPRSRASSVKDDPHILPSIQNERYTPRQYYVLTNAGKPVFCSHDNSSDDNITNLMGVAQALISIFAEDDDRIRCIIKGRYRIAFLLKAPLYLFCVSDWGEPEHVLRSHLEYIHLHILSVVSSTQLSRVFQRRSNFDLSRLLDGTETFLRNLVDRSQYDFSYLTSTLQPLRMAPALRDTAAASLMPPSKFRDLLYVLLIASGHIVTLLRPKKHSIHPSDLHLLINTLASSPTIRSTETWLPICFPKFNPAGFVHAYVSYDIEDVGLVFVSADREAFEDLRAWKQIVVEKLESDKTLIKIKESIPLHPYNVSLLGCPGLRHFIYKSRQHVQITQPAWGAPYMEDSSDHKRLITTYQKLHDAVHAKSGQSSPLKLVYMRTEHEACLAWVTKPFELYLAVSPQLSKSAIVAAANTVARWVLAEEGRVFLKDAPVF